MKVFSKTMLKKSTCDKFEYGNLKTAEYLKVKGSKSLGNNDNSLSCVLTFLT